MTEPTLEQREDILTRELNKVIPLKPHDREDWHEDAVCRQLASKEPTPRDQGKVADWWFADSRPSGKAKKVGHAPVEATAADICFSCPVREACLKYAADTEQEYGTWGGLQAEILRDHDYNFNKLVELGNPFDTEDTESPYHRNNIRRVGNFSKVRKEAA